MPGCDDGLGAGFGRPPLFSGLDRTTGFSGGWCRIGRGFGRLAADFRGFFKDIRRRPFVLLRKGLKFGEAFRWQGHAATRITGAGNKFPAFAAPDDQFFFITPGTGKSGRPGRWLRWQRLTGIAIGGLNGFTFRIAGTAKKTGRTARRV